MASTGISPGKGPSLAADFEPSANGPVQAPENTSVAAKKIEDFGITSIKLESYTENDVSLSPQKVNDVEIHNEENQGDKQVYLSPQKVNGVEIHDEENQGDKQVLELNWTPDELEQLVTNLATCLPRHDYVRFSNLVNKLDWEKVRFGQYTAAECKEKWLQIGSKLRRFRTLTDMVTDAKIWVQRPLQHQQKLSYISSKKQKHPEMPRKPMTPFIRYLVKERKQHIKDNPGVAKADHFKLLRKKYYNELPVEIRREYEKAYKKENKVYKKELKKFKEGQKKQFPTCQQLPQQAAPTEGPDEPRDSKLKEEFGQEQPKMPRKPTTPFIRYFLKERKQHIKDNPEMAKKDHKKLLLKKYQELPVEIRQEFEKAYEKECQVYTQEFKKFKEGQKKQFPILQQLPQQAAPTEGPDEPRDSKLKEEFSQMNADSESDIEKTRNKYKRKQKELAFELSERKAKLHMQNQPKMPRKPMTPFIRYFLKERQQHIKDNPEVAEKDHMKLLLKKYKELPCEIRQEYEEAYEKDGKVYIQELKKFNTGHKEQLPQQAAPMEGPDKARSAFRFFVEYKLKEEFSQMDQKEANKKLKKAWGTLTDEGKAEWIEKAHLDRLRYLRELEECRTERPDFDPGPAKAVFRKFEKKIKDRSDGETEIPSKSSE